MIMVTARGEEADRIRGLELGADDYVVKPFSVNELLLRVKAVLRRADAEEEPGAAARGAAASSSTARAHEVRRGRPGGGAHRARVPAAAARCSSGRAGCRRRETLLSDVWGISAEIHTRTVDTHIKRLREKLGPAGDIIETVRGVGYKLGAPLSACRPAMPARFLILLLLLPAVAAGVLLACWATRARPAGGRAGPSRAR